jgi:hypothetical protein
VPKWLEKNSHKTFGIMTENVANIVGSQAEKDLSAWLSAFKDFF